MLKSLLFSLLSILLVISILVPSIEILCEKDVEKVLVMDLNEEENNSNETEKKFDQKKLFFTNLNQKGNLQFFQEIIKSQTSLIPYSDFSFEIIVPPPERLS